LTTAIDELTRLGCNQGHHHLHISNHPNQHNNACCDPDNPVFIPPTSVTATRCEISVRGTPNDDVDSGGGGSTRRHTFGGGDEDVGTSAACGVNGRNRNRAGRHYSSAAVPGQQQRRRVRRKTKADRGNGKVQSMFR
jgi:hypothetical protein